MHFNHQDGFMTLLRKILTTIPTALLLLLGICAVDATAGDKIAVLVSSSEAPFEETLAGFQAFLAKQGVKPEYEVFRLAGDPSKAEQALQKIKKNGFRVLFALGSIATEAAVLKVPDLPIVSCLVLRSDSFAQAKNATGVALEFPIETQLNWIKTMLPDAQTVGVIYNPTENKKRVEEAGRIARRLGLRLEAFEAHTPQDIPSALAALAKRVDVLWGLPDALTLSSQMAKHILLFAFRNSIPFVGPSDAWVRAGALYALEWDYRDLGMQCGDKAFQVLKGAQPRDLAPTTPRKVLYSINQKTAEQLKIELPDEAGRKARSVY
jgi:putative ABC transport system substrate-binding protein